MAGRQYMKRQRIEIECILPGGQADREKISKVAAKTAWQASEEADYIVGYRKGRHLDRHADKW
jgi:hypothetical protein